MVATDYVGLWQEPWILGEMLLVRLAVNVPCYIEQQKRTWSSIGDFLANYLGLEKGGESVSLLEDVSQAVGSWEAE